MVFTFVRYFVEIENMSRKVLSQNLEALIFFIKDRTTSLVDPKKITDWQNVLFDGSKLVSNTDLRISPLFATYAPNELAIRVLALSGK